MELFKNEGAQSMLQYKRKKTEKKKKDASKLIHHKKDENVTKNFNKYKTFENWALCFEKVVQQDLFPHSVHCAILC